METISKPKVINWNREFSTQHGTYHVFDIEFENGVKGEFITTKKEQIKFNLGKEVNYSTEEKTNKRGESYLKIDKVRPVYTPGVGGSGNAGGNKRSKDVEKSIVASVSLDCAAILVSKLKVEDKIEDISAIHGIADLFFDHIIEKSIGDTQLSINYQSRLKEVINYLVELPHLKITSSTKVLEYVEIEVAYLKSKIA